MSRRAAAYDARVAYPVYWTQIAERGRSKPPIAVPYGDGFRLLGVSDAGSGQMRLQVAPQYQTGHQVWYEPPELHAAFESRGPRVERQRSVAKVRGGSLVKQPRWLIGSALGVVALLALVNPVSAIRNSTAGTGSAMSRLGSLGIGVSSSSFRIEPAPVIDASSPPKEAIAEVAPPLEGAPQTKSYDVVGPPTISVERIESVLKRYGSPAVGRGQALYDLGVRYGMNPAYALAFFVHESGCGTQGVARFTQSLGNIRWTPGFENYEGYRRYGSWEEGMEDWYKLIGDLYIKEWSLRTVDEIIPVYAPYGDNNHPPTYIASVKRMVDEWK